MLTQNLNEADVILYVHCGSAKEPANEKMAQKLQALLNSGKHVAVIDASEDYESSQMLLPVLLANNVTINKLVFLLGLEHLRQRGRHSHSAKCNIYRSA